jgi:hypothetical protein
VLYASERADQRQKLERLCRYIGRPAIAEQHLSLTPNCNVRYQQFLPDRSAIRLAVLCCRRSPWRVLDCDHLVPLKDSS